MIEYIINKKRVYIVIGFLIFSLIHILFFCTCSKKNINYNLSDQFITSILDSAVIQYMNMHKSVADNVLPRSIDKEQDSLITCKSDWWVSGFFPGSLWYLYEYSGNPEVKNAAIARTALVENEKNNVRTHDVGFMLYCSFGNGLKITGDKHYREVLISGANSLISRYSSKVGCIRSWDFGEWKYPVIVDNMMNLELLFWASKETGDQKFYNIAVNHADNTLKNHYRDDYSCYHVLDYNPETGEVILKMTEQGYSDESAWSRGQSWGLYGFTMAFRETKDNNYLERAKKIAGFILNHPNLPEDYIPYWDYNAPDIPDTYRDVSAAAIMCSALLELHQYVEHNTGQQYLHAAEKILTSLSQPVYKAKIGENHNFILMHGVGSFPGNSEIDVPLTYADYYYLESLMRYRRLLHE